MEGPDFGTSQIWNNNNNNKRGKKKQCMTHLLLKSRNLIFKFYTKFSISV